jgi:hypothetical protein
MFRQRILPFLKDVFGQKEVSSSYTLKNQVFYGACAQGNNHFWLRAELLNLKRLSNFVRN